MPSVLRKSVLSPSASLAPAMPVELITSAQTPTKPPRPDRNPALDFTKGALVLVMVLYHWANYFLNLSWTFYKYLHFLTPSFIFIAGFMISNVYLSKYASTKSGLSKRLFTRGLKLLAIFLFLNLGRTLVVTMLGSGVLVRNPLDPWNLFAVFASGNLP